MSILLRTQGKRLVGEKHTILLLPTKVTPRPAAAAALHRGNRAVEVPRSPGCAKLGGSRSLSSPLTSARFTRLSMDGNSKRKGSISLGQDVTAKRGRWEAELAGPPSESSPTASGSALVHSTQVHGGTLTVVGRDNNNTTTIHNYNYNCAPQTVPVDVLDILNSLSLPNFRDIQLDTLAKATEGTCIWLTSGEIFLFWVENGKILWGIGIPGAGKTVLASIVIRYLEGLENTSGGVICVAYVYLRYSEPLAIRDILESLVKQIVERHTDLIPSIEALYARHQQERTKPSQQELKGVLEGFVVCGKTLFFVLDALDKMRVEDRPILLRLLASLDARIFITSRPLEPLQRQFADAQVFDIAASPSDLDLHIKNFLQHSPEVMALIEGTDLEEQIAETIHRKSGGMFLHAKLQLEALRNCVSALDVEETLQGFPNDIVAIYAKTWERILAQGPKQSTLAKLVLLWITHVDGEMTIDMLRRAVATCPKTYAFETKRMVPEALLLTVCCGLVSVDEKTRLVRLIHEFHPRFTIAFYSLGCDPDYTTRDAIIPRILELFPVPHALLGHVCIVHITKSGFLHFVSENDEWHSRIDDFGSVLYNDTLLEYDHQSWAHHTRQCGRYTPIISAVADLILNCTTYPLGDSVDIGGPLHVAAFYGFEDVILSAAQVHSPNSGTLLYNVLPLALAVERGHLASAKALLSLPGINVNVLGIQGEHAFITAATSGHIECIELLAQAPGIDINVVNTLSETALISAAIGGHAEVVKFLVRLPGIRIHAVDPSGRTALMRAISRGHTKVVQELLSAQGIDINHVYLFSPILYTPKKHWTALTLAVSRCHINIVKKLLEVPGIDVNAAPDADGETALSHAFAARHRAIVDLLLAFPGTVVPHWIQNEMRTNSNDKIRWDDGRDVEDEGEDEEEGDEFHDE
ncbi:hypothetical protein BKA70DRAFT_1536466 [Coprinopsis sp. MPI-PUGE-AT-0042]|nr:hypothetical protein BKA70DRAFT_1536466 [Coprinopsis sp. MPI-PUGE-AT-0042]